MLVKNWMTKDVITVQADNSIETAMNLLSRHAIHSLPVTEKNRLVGIVSKCDLEGTLTSKYQEHEINDKILYNKVSQLMTRDVITVPIDYTVEETVEVIIKKGIHGVPVINDKNEVIGIITKTDLLRAIIDLTGVNRRGIQYAIEVEDRPGSIKELSDTIRSHGGRMASILTFREGVSDGYRKIYIRIYGIDRFRLSSLNEVLKKKATLVYVVDHLEIRRERSG